MKIHPVGAELFHEDGRTGTTKLIVTFRDYANVPKNIPLILCTHFSKFYQTLIMF